MPSGQVFKTLIVHGDKTGYLIVCVPVDRELDLKALAKASGNKKAEMVPLKDVQGLTGYIRGGVSPVGVKKPYPVYIDESAKNWPVISLSARLRGCQMLVAPGDLEKMLALEMSALSK
jgi:Cys-tRNA(Pro)/Cys-tRNA(Cys) deacylase